VYLAGGYFQVNNPVIGTPSWRHAGFGHLREGVQNLTPRAGRSVDQKTMPFYVVRPRSGSGEIVRQSPGLHQVDMLQGALLQAHGIWFSAAPGRVGGSHA